MSQSKLYQEEFHPSPLHHTWLEFRQSHLALVGLWCLGVFLLLAILGPLLTPYSPIAQDTEALLIPPAWHPSGNINHLFGTDSLGRDIFTRMIYGLRMTLGISILMVLIAMLIGIGMGALAGLTRGMRSSAINHILDAIMAIPTLLLAIIIIAILGTGLINSMWAITLALIPQFTHYTRDFVRRESRKDYVLAARLDGAGHTHIFFYSILPNMVEMLVVQGTLALSAAILNISALGFLNLGAQAPSSELGVMLSEGLNVAYIAPWSVFLPGSAIFLVMLSVNLVGDGLRSALRNRLRH